MHHMSDTTTGTQQDTKQYRSTATAQEIAARLAGARRVVVLTHMKPDGDAVGSSAALVRALNLGTPGRAEAWYAGPMPMWFAPIVETTPVKVIDADGPPSHADPDAVVVVDTGSWTQLEPFHDWLVKRREECIIVDHHVRGDEDVAPVRLIDAASAAACQPVAEICRVLLGKPSLSALPPEVAEMLYLGLATDTGWFRHSNVDKRVMVTAGELLEAGARNVRLYQEVEQRSTQGRLRLMARAIESLELFDNDRFAIMTLSMEDFNECGADPGESGGLVDLPQTISTVLATALLTRVDYGDHGGKKGEASLLTKLSLRSKSGAKFIDVNRVCAEFGGGGHIHAAGARVRMTVEDVKKKLIELVKAQTARF